MTFPMAIQLMRVSFRNPLLFTLYPSSLNEQDREAGRTAVLTLVHLRISREAL